MDSMKRPKFWYQLTLWQEEIGQLDFAVKPLIDDGKKYAIMKDSSGRFAVYTEGNDLEREYREECYASFDKDLYARLSMVDGCIY